MSPFRTVLLLNYDQISNLCFYANQDGCMHDLKKGTSDAVPVARHARCRLVDRDHLGRLIRCGILAPMLDDNPYDCTRSLVCDVRRDRDRAGYPE